jgi:hypothetical protein
MIYISEYPSSDGMHHLLYIAITSKQLTIQKYLCFYSVELARPKGSYLYPDRRGVTGGSFLPAPAPRAPCSRPLLPAPAPFAPCSHPSAPCTHQLPNHLVF